MVPNGLWLSTNCLTSSKTWPAIYWWTHWHLVSIYALIRTFIEIDRTFLRLDAIRAPFGTMVFACFCYFSKCWKLKISPWDVTSFNFADFWRGLGQHRGEPAPERRVSWCRSPWTSSSTSPWIGISPIFKKLLEFLNICFHFFRFFFQASKQQERA